jgi:hypothetical protein
MRGLFFCVDAPPGLRRRLDTLARAPLNSVILLACFVRSARPEAFPGEVVTGSPQEMRPA